MGRLLPFKSEPTRTPDEPRVLDLDDDATEEALSALSSDTARKILATLYEEPKTPPEIRDEVGTSLQNVHYHVERLEAAELIQPAGEGYSEKGTEMTIYAPASEALVLFAGREHDRSRLKTALTRLLGSVGLLAVASLAVRRLFGGSGANLGDYGVSFGMGSQSGAERGADDGGDGGGAGGGDGASDAGGGDGGDAGASGGDGGGAGPEPEDDAVTSTTTDGGDIGIFGGEDTATDTAGATPSPTPDPATATQSTPAATEVPSATPTPAGTPSPTPAGTPTPAATPSPTVTATPTATTTPTATQTATPQPTPTTTEPPSPTPTETGMDSGTITLDTATQVPAETVDGARRVAGSGDSLLADPAVAFFLGGLFMLLVVTAWWYVQS
ncbi:helix-turn-helix domain-containing protein [Halosimplex rubrum]|uniref:Helix-turn-helix domain-containing protein n=1 Tax=Halosimplex rubrum TaxID=869889 RepID=A0A7D5PAZ4_9EURY|nr:winged helix-turn-helix domain-containing protein [Halosimplex rubrum]QLH78580.1 helix-turn-helix domain-containing protein [Halosimplex rubrum]